jgi:hypothetical protein
MNRKDRDTATRTDPEDAGKDTPENKLAKGPRDRMGKRGVEAMMMSDEKIAEGEWQR